MLIIISDGMPTDDWQMLASQAQELSRRRKLASLPIDVNQADINVLGRFSSHSTARLTLG
ncbi:hypothetical protein LX59_01456 [Azomonas agilis]|uniref:Uncharacterized protein n=1 Tax=Azomonas agilis TaxID=116849 RepID=A0A562IYH8_9GAMM|nr:hypothetical protein [Azomonas agilis]TWH75946.1 hypothetical protein LX59_01456 [Azomonas agilis]